MGSTTRGSVDPPSEGILVPSQPGKETGPSSRSIRGASRYSRDGSSGSIGPRFEAVSTTRTDGRTRIGAHARELEGARSELLLEAVRRGSAPARVSCSDRIRLPLPPRPGGRNAREDRTGPRLFPSEVLDFELVRPARRRADPFFLLSSGNGKNGHRRKVLPRGPTDARLSSRRIPRERSRRRGIPIDTGVDRTFRTFRDWHDSRARNASLCGSFAFAGARRRRSCGPLALCVV